jgi:CRISPR-associated endonuclease/helicase Cas3
MLGLDTIFAHSLPEEDVSRWETLETHATAVAQAAAARAAAFGWGPAASALGLLHDIGKASQAFQTYLRAGHSAKIRVDHSTAGARVAQNQFPAGLGRLFAFCVAVIMQDCQTPRI